MVEVNLKNFIDGGHMTDLTPILEAPKPPENPTTTTEAVPTREEILANLRNREQKLLTELENNRQEYERIAQELMEIRREIIMNTPDEYDMAPSGTIRIRLEPDNPSPSDEGPTGRAFRFAPRQTAMRNRQAVMRDILRRSILRRRIAAMTGFPSSRPRSFPRTFLIPVRRFGLPFFLRVNRRPQLTIRAPLADDTQVLTEPRQLPIVVDERNPEIQTRPFEPVPRVTDVVSDTPMDNDNVPPTDVP
jgi:hypothetical protein